ncbi:ligase-associated DNA damage response endonuclease PdeM [Limibacillus halophilus]|uniref:Calcineurin-like phosphoesterase domain-containing protein n=1 Tax=Limibacillus halophilus TaxID=1579333 RepID=A0A839ST90_9PROT|nr:ligase-associated DNA damage response endonuclease PdeM [Limibacillus halophilus]MBB3064930.1 hypothetical protein [Limibacillus halophilus]
MVLSSQPAAFLTPLTAQEHSIQLNGANLVLRVSGALFWPARATLVVADLHLEKASSFWRQGQLLPPYDSQETLARLTDELRNIKPVKRVICLGDSFHDSEAGNRLQPDSRRWLEAWTSHLEWIWIAGNHDPDPRGSWGGYVMEELRDGPLVFRHQAQAGGVLNGGEVSGHFHPKAAIRVRGKRLTGPAFIEDGKRLILPAFGALTGGLDVSDPAIAGLFESGVRTHLLGRRSIATLSSGIVG